MRKVRVTFTQVEGVWSAESEDVPEWLAVGSSFGEVQDLAEEGLAFYLDEDSVRVVPVVIGSVVWPTKPWGGPTNNGTSENVPREQHNTLLPFNCSQTCTHGAL